MGSAENLRTEIIGNEIAMGRLKGFLHSGRVPHALLLAGAPGTGKRRAARLFAAQLLCGAVAAPCGQCESCRRMFEGAHPDFHLLQPQGQNIKIEQIRALQTAVALKPALSRRRVAVIQQADAMNEQAANSLLKTLEEPLSEVFFILTADNLRGMPTTLLSRCTVVKFLPLPTSAVTDVLLAHGEAADKAAQLAELSAGSCSLALRLCGDDGNQLLMLVGRVFAENRSMDARNLWQLSEELAGLNKEQLELFCLLSNMLLRDLQLLNEGSELRLYYESQRQELERAAVQWSHRRIAAAMDSVQKVAEMVRVNGNVKMDMISFLLSLR